MATTTSITLTQGDDLDVYRTISAIPSGTSVSDAWLMVKLHASDLDAAALISKHITTSSVAGTGQITDSGSTTLTAQLYFQLTAANSSGLTPGTTYVLSVKVKLASGKEATTEIGTLSANQAVILAT